MLPQDRADSGDRTRLCDTDPELFRVSVTKSRGQVRVATFNIQYGRTAAGDVDVGLVATVVAGLDAEIVALQEVDVGVARSGGIDEAAEIAGAAGMTSRFGAAARIGWRGRFGNALLARDPITDVEVARLPRLVRRGRRRSALVASVGPVSVAVTHLSVWPPDTWVQLAAVVELLGRRPAPRILLGDLNLPPAHVVSRVRAAGLTLAGGPPSFPASQPFTRIDHIAVAGMRIGDVTVVPAPVSDHRAVVAELT